MDRYSPLIQATTIAFRLPVARSPIIGRGSDLARIDSLLAEGARLVTLVGAGGVGKTRLALAVADAQRAAFDGRVGWVSLGELTDSDLVLDSIARALGVDTQGRDPADALTAALGGESALLVIDNMEHLSGASMALAALLDEAPALRLLVTSRVPLRLRAEREMRIDPFPPVDGETDPATLRAHPAIRLFAERARAVEAGFEPDAADLARIAGIVAQLDYLPLAIELAAVRVRHFSLDEIGSLLSSRLDLLTGGPRDAPDRHRTIRGAISWSYELLRPEEQRLFRALSVFPGAFTLESAVQLVEPAGISRLETIELVSALVDQNLLIRLNEPGAGRYVMLGAMREFGQALLTAHGEAGPVRDRLADLVIGRISPPPASSQQDVDWLGRVERSMDDLRATLGWLLSEGAGLRALQLVTDLGGWWNSRGNPREGRRMYAAALALEPEAGNRLRFEALRDYAWLLALTGELDQALGLREEVRTLAAAVDDPYQAIKSEQLMGALAFVEGDFQEGRARTEHAIELAEADGLAHKFSGLVFNLATLSEIDGDYAQAAAYHRRGLELIDRNDKRGLYSMHQMGLSSLALRANDWQEADRLAREVWADVLAVRDQQTVSGALLVKSEVLLHAGDPLRAARLFGAAERLMMIYGRVLIEFEVAEIADVRERLARALPADDLQREIAVGRVMTLDELSAEMMVPAVAATGAPGAAIPSVLTPRETEVARLLVEGKTNPEIGAVLFISERTVQSHVANIMTKLGVSSRAAVAATVVRERLV